MFYIRVSAWSDSGKNSLPDLLFFCILTWRRESKATMVHNTDLNCMDPLICGFISISTVSLFISVGFTSTDSQSQVKNIVFDLMLIDSVDSREPLWSQYLYTNFQLCGSLVPLTPDDYSRVNCNPIQRALPS